MAARDGSDAPDARTDQQEIDESEIRAEVAGTPLAERDPGRDRRADEREKRLDLREQRLDDRQAGLDGDRPRHSDPGEP